MSNPYQIQKANIARGAFIGLWELLLQVVVAAGYVALQIALMRGLAYFCGNADTDLGRVFTVLTSTIVSVFVLFLTNRLIFKTHVATLGLLSGAAFFSYFYIIHPTGDRITTFLAVITYGSSLVNMLLAVCGPAVVGLTFWLRPNNSFNRKPLRGSG